MFETVFLGAASTILVIAILGLASLQDLNKRIIEDYIWYSGILSGLFLSGLKLYLGILDPTSWLVSLSSGFALALISFKLKFLSGADGKSIITLSIIFPTWQEFFIHTSGIALPPVMSVYFCFLLLVAGLTLSVLFFNLISRNYLELRGENFNGKLRILLTCVKINIDKIDLDKHYLIEKIDGDRKIITYSNEAAVKSGLEDLKNFKKSKGEKLDAWVYPNWPLIPLILVAFILVSISANFF